MNVLVVLIAVGVLIVAVIGVVFAVKSGVAEKAEKERAAEEEALRKPCKHCGRLVNTPHATVHEKCGEMAARGMTNAQIVTELSGVSATVYAPPTPLGQISSGKLFGIIFGALWAFTASATVVYLILHALIDAAPQ